MRLELTAEDMPPEVLQAALTTAAREALDSLQLFDAVGAAKLLRMPTQAFRRLAKKHNAGSFDFGQRAARWSGKQLREIMAAHEVRGAPSQ
jgi:sugar/nucleoside kinase (ribokinase family)